MIWSKPTGFNPSCNRAPKIRRQEGGRAIFFIWPGSTTGKSLRARGQAILTGHHPSRQHSPGLAVVSIVPSTCWWCPCSESNPRVRLSWVTSLRACMHGGKAEWLQSRLWQSTSSRACLHWDRLCDYSQDCDRALLVGRVCTDTGCVVIVKTVIELF